MDSRLEVFGSENGGARLLLLIRCLAKGRLRVLISSKYTNKHTSKLVSWVAHLELALYVELGVVTRVVRRKMQKQKYDIFMYYNP